MPDSPNSDMVQIADGSMKIRDGNQNRPAAEGLIKRDQVGQFCLLAGATTYAVHDVFVQHYKAGGTILNFSAARCFAECFCEGKTVAANLHKGDPAEGWLIFVPTEPNRTAAVGPTSNLNGMVGQVDMTHICPNPRGADRRASQHLFSSPFLAGASCLRHC